MCRFTVVSWNCRRATAASPLWDYFLELDPTVALLQEVAGLPLAIRERYDVELVPATNRNGGQQKFGTALLVKGRLGAAVAIKSTSEWTDSMLGGFAGNLLCRELIPVDGLAITAVAVYSPAWPVGRTQLDGVNAGDSPLRAGPDIWLSDILLASLERHSPTTTDRWIVAGDFNFCESFDQKSWSAGGNGKYLSRMDALGLVECLRSSKGEITPTFRNPRGGAVAYQIDYLFATEALASHLTSCYTGSHERVLESGISDHLPIIAHFDIPDGLQ